MAVVVAPMPAVMPEVAVTGIAVVRLAGKVLLHAADLVFEHARFGAGQAVAAVRAVQLLQPGDLLVEARRFLPRKLVAGLGDVDLPVELRDLCLHVRAVVEERRGGSRDGGAQGQRNRQRGGDQFGQLVHRTILSIRAEDLGGLSDVFRFRTIPMNSGKMDCRGNALIYREMSPASRRA